MAGCWWSRRNSERTYIYAADPGLRSKDIKLLIVNLDQRDTVVLKLKVNPDRLAQMMDEPESMSGLVQRRWQAVECQRPGKAGIADCRSTIAD